MQFLTHVLPNGLEIVAECNPHAYSTALEFIVKAGACDETDEIAGVSHFLEHMAFKGTPTRTAADVNRELDEMGSYCNAGTVEEATVYYAAVLPENRTWATEVLADILRPSLREADFATEKKVILEEIQKAEDEPPFLADEKCRAAFFGEHPLGRSVLGTTASVEALSVAAMQDYFRRRYTPNNIIVAAAGRVDFDRLVADCRRACGDWPSPSVTGAECAADFATAAAGQRVSSAWQGIGHAAVSLGNVGWPHGIATTTAMRPRSWQSFWATTPAAGSTGNWSIRASPRPPC